MDRDVTEIRLQKYHETPDDITPSITICFMSPFHEEKFTKYFRQHTYTDIRLTQNYTAEEVRAIITNFQAFIDGDETFLKDVASFTENTTYENLLETLQAIDYDKVTLDLADLVSRFRISIPISLRLVDSLSYYVQDNVWVSNEDGKIKSHSLTEMKYVTTYVSARQPYYKCITVDLPMKLRMAIREVEIRLNTSIFSYGLSMSQFYFYLTYPKQFLRAPVGNRLQLPERGGSQCYKFEVYVGSMKTFKRRDKTNAPCNTDWRHHDEKQTNDILEKVGCNPEHWKIQSDLPHCSNPKQFSEINKRLHEKDAFMAPCRSIEKLSKVTKGTDLGPKCLLERYLDLRFYLDEETFYEEVILVPAYTLQNLVGNAGKDGVTSF